MSHPTSRHLSTLEKAGYVKIEKTFEDRKPRTWICATPAGRKALAGKIAALRDIVKAADGTPVPQASRRRRPATT